MTSETRILAGVLGTIVVLAAVAAAQPAPQPSARPSGQPQAQPGGKPAATSNDSPEELRKKESYALGMNIGLYLKRQGYDLDLDLMQATIKETLAGTPPKYTPQEARQIEMAYHGAINTIRAEKNKKLGEEFLAENKKKEGVKTKMVGCADGKMAELQYKIIKEGTGASPHTNDIVSVSYRGTLINGTEFDASKPDQPMKRPANRFIAGWNEALPMMKVGSKWQLFIPAALAYGDAQPTPAIEPGSTLLFDLELLGVEAPAPPAPPPPAPAPLTSDIIKVPSAEEMKKGAKIEILKPEEAAKQAAQEQQKK